MIKSVARVMRRGWVVGTAEGCNGSGVGGVCMDRNLERGLYPPPPEKNAMTRFGTCFHHVDYKFAGPFSALTKHLQT